MFHIGNFQNIFVFNFENAPALGGSVFRMRLRPMSMRMERFSNRNGACVFVLTFLMGDSIHLRENLPMIPLRRKTIPPSMDMIPYECSGCFSGRFIRGHACRPKLPYEEGRG